MSLSKSNEDDENKLENKSDLPFFIQKYPPQ
jgi:hypothetical protein